MNKARYLAGLIMLALNYPFGWGGVAFGAALYLKTKNALWLAVASGFYLLSWLLLVLGFILAGTEGLRHLRFFWRRTIRRLKFLHMRINNEKNSGSPG